MSVRLGCGETDYLGGLLGYGWEFGAGFFDGNVVAKAGGRAQWGGLDVAFTQ